MKPDIRSKRIELGLTLEEVGNLVGVGKSTVRKWETGDIENMKRDKIVKLAKALRVSPSFIMGFEEEQPQQDTLAAHLEGDYTEEELQKIREYAEFVRQSRKGWFTLGRYEDLLIKHSNMIINDTLNLPGKFKGFYDNGVILIDNDLTLFNKHETLAEELAHHEITYSNILDQSEIQNRKYELKARRLANESVITLDGIIDSFLYGVCNLHEMSQFFEVTEKFILNTINHYKQKHGLSTYHNGYIITFEPLNVYEYKEME